VTSVRRVRGRLGFALSVIALSWSFQSCDELKQELGLAEISLHVEDTNCETATVGWGDGSDDDPQQVVALPWSQSIGTGSGVVLVLVARRECDDAGTVTAEIRLDGDLEDRGQASGSFAVAAASTSFF
jgi:hypothetical protein